MGTDEKPSGLSLPSETETGHGRDDLICIVVGLIIGHSLSDPDIDYILQLAHKTASPQHPIYMIAADFTKADERELLEKYNIVLVQYSNSDGGHAQLRRLLMSADRFIVPRRWSKGRVEFSVRPKEEAESAAALFIYQRLRGAQKGRRISPLILSELFASAAVGTTKDELVNQASLKSFQRQDAAFSDALNEALDDLVQQGLAITVSDRYSITEKGHTQVKEFQAVRETEREQAYGQFILNLKSGYVDLTQEQERQCRQLSEDVVVASFASRGLTIANQVFAGQFAGAEELSDIFRCVSDAAADLAEENLKAAFVEAMYLFLIEPNTPQKKYLASVSQGYFLFHLLGLDPKCVRIRHEVFGKTLWVCDSSVLLPLLAVGCHNYDYAIELFRILRDAQAVLCTTSKLLQESWEHFEWAVNFMRMNGAESPEFLRAALVKGSYKQNLFLDGYIRLSAEGRVGNFADYIGLISLKEWGRVSLEEFVARHDVRVLTLSGMNGFLQEDWGELEEAKVIISEERKRIGTYRSELQVESEAEVWMLIKHIRSGKYSLPGSGKGIESVYFVSQSRVLDKVFQPGAISTWTPEALYRYISTLPGKQMDPELLQQCMLHEYYYAGISFIDRDRYLRFFGPSVDAAKASYDQEKAKYIAEVEFTHAKQLDEAFEKTPDLEKPFFIAQMGWRLAEVSRQKEEQAKQRALEAETKVKELEAEKDKVWKKREKIRDEQEAARLRNLQNPKHVRKRLKQAKKRKKKQKK